MKLAKAGPILLAGDLYHYPEERTMNRFPTFEFNKEQSAASRAMIDDFLKRTNAQLWIEHDLETAILREIEAVLLELGTGFAFVARQKRMSVGKDDFHLDLLFYHLKLRAFVVIDLKMKPFQPAARVRRVKPRALSKR